ncbi:MAG: Maf family protein [Vicinamibacterales bacterium]
MQQLVLASASPRRAELLRGAGIQFEVLAANVDERIYPEEAPETYVRRVAENKARAVRLVAGGWPVLAADTVVIVGSAVLGKPADAADARRMLRMLSGREHQVMTGVALASSGGATPSASVRAPDNSDSAGDLMTRVATTIVEFAPLLSEDIDWYVATGEPMDKAGAYAIQGLASRYVTRIDGSYSNVVGLPVALVWEMLVASGVCSKR